MPPQSQYASALQSLRLLHLPHGKQKHLSPGGFPAPETAVTWRRPRTSITTVNSGRSDIIHCHKSMEQLHLQQR